MIVNKNRELKPFEVSQAVEETKYNRLCQEAAMSLLSNKNHGVMHLLRKLCSKIINPLWIVEAKLWKETPRH